MAPIRPTNEAAPLPLRGQVGRKENRCAVNRAVMHTVRSQVGRKENRFAVSQDERRTMQARLALRTQAVCKE